MERRRKGNERREGEGKNKRASGSRWTAGSRSCIIFSPGEEG